MKSFAKVNIFLKIVGTRGAYHELSSRFMIVKSLFDEVDIIPSDSNRFEIDGNFSCKLEQNTIYKAYLELLKIEPKVESFFKSNKVIIDKNIPEGAGLGGGSSNCATFLKLVNDKCELNLTKDTLSQIGSKIGADVSFFVYDFEVANVSGIGEIVEQSNEKALDLEIFTPDINCNTALVYKTFREKFFKLENNINNYLLKNSCEIFEKFDIEDANDLFLSATHLYPQLLDFKKENWLFSGSGSSFFRLK